MPNIEEMFSDMPRLITYNYMVIMWTIGVIAVLKAGFAFYKTMKMAKKRS